MDHTKPQLLCILHINVVIADGSCGNTFNPQIMKLLQHRLVKYGRDHIHHIIACCHVKVLQAGRLGGVIIFHIVFRTEFFKKRKLIKGSHTVYK